MKSLADGVLVVCAVLVTGVTIHRYLDKAPSGAASGEVHDEEALAPTDLRMGSPEAKHELIVFTDYECPACRRFESESLEPLLREAGDSVAVYYRQFPLEQAHRQALEAAAHAECANADGRFAEMHRYLFATALDSTREWTRGAISAAGIGDSVAFAKCLTAESTIKRIKMDQAIAHRIGANGTPALIIKGRLQVGGMPLEELQERLFKSR